MDLAHPARKGFGQRSEGLAAGPPRPARPPGVGTAARPHAPEIPPSARACV